jgi:hypothetical protein
MVTVTLDIDPVVGTAVIVVVIVIVSAVFTASVTFLLSGLMWRLCMAVSHISSITSSLSVFSPLIALLSFRGYLPSYPLSLSLPIGISADGSGSKE